MRAFSPCGIVTAWETSRFAKVIDMATHETLTDNAGLASILGPGRPGLPGTTFGSLSIWSGQIIGFSPAGNVVVEVQVSGILGITTIQAEVFGQQVYDGTGISGLAQVNVIKVEWSLPDSATVIARYQFDTAVPFPLSIGRFVGDYRFVDIINEGVTHEQLFANYFQNSDTLVGAGATDNMRGGGSADILDGAGGADILGGDEGNDTFIYRNGDAVAGETVDGGADIDHILAIGAAATGDIGQAGNVDISNLLISNLEEVWTNGTEVVITAAQLTLGGFQNFVGKNNALDMLTITNVNFGNFSALGLNTWEAQDLVSILGTTTNDAVTGTGFADNFIGYAGQDTFNGGAGNDRFLIQSGDFNPNDIFNGGADSDVLQVDGQSVTNFDVGTKTDLRSLQLNSVETLDAVKGEFIIDAYALAGTLYGTTAAPIAGPGTINKIIGNSTNTLSQSVLLEIRAGSALMVDLRNTVFENWNDGFYIDKLVRIVAGTQTRLIYAASNEENWVNGSAASAGIYVFGGSQEDTLFGSYLQDYVIGGAGTDYIYGLSGNDGLGGDAGNDWVWGGVGDDIVAGAAGNDNLFGEDGNDRLSGGLDADAMTGGIGNDIYVVDNLLDAVTELSGIGSGVDFIYSSISLTMAANTERLFLTGTDNINGTGLNVQVDVLTGNTGNNILNGLTGNDIMRGLQGNDTYIVDATSDVIEEFTGYGTDAIKSTATYTMALNTERLYLLGSGAIDGTGLNGRADLIVGNIGANKLNGLTGNDMLTGGLGNDTFIFNTALSATTNRDTITDFNVVADTIHLENAIFTALAATGTLAANLFESNSIAEQSGSEVIVYDKANGDLFYDTNGAALAGGLVQFADVANNTALTNADFFVI